MASSIVASARSACEQYVEWAPDDWSRREAKDMLDRGDETLLVARFGKRIAFGTAGLRAVMGAGTAAMNPLVILQTCQGLCQYGQEAIPNFKSRGVVIGFDGRHHSREFADLAAFVFMSQGVTVHLMRKMIPTPFVPFGVVQLRTAIGVMVTASHNPKQDNGFKVYWSNGAQIVPPHDSNIAAAIDNNLRPWMEYRGFTLDHQALAANDPTERLWTSYFQTISAPPYCNVSGDFPTPIKVTYTAMHGVGTAAVLAAFQSFRLPPPIQVAEQCTPDPEFSTVKYPNPEEGAGALALAMKAAESAGSRLILANDPDADRLAVAERTCDGNWRIFNGNEIAALFADWLWTCYLERNPKCDRSKAFMVASCVSSRYLEAMAAHEGFLFQDTLTGFKWLGNAIIDMEARDLTFLFAYEVEIGFLTGNMSYDKDGVRMAAVFAELANSLYRQHSTCTSRLEELYKKYGYFSMKASYFFCESRSVMDRIFDRLRAGDYRPHSSTSVKSVRDVTRGLDSSQPDGRSRLPAMPNDQMLTFAFADGTLVTLRNSGTEPKLKYYVECRDSSRAASDAKLAVMARYVIDEFIQPTVHGLAAPK
ncbi:unnamed protein product (mitochondrion) [Plasmodiophora brassicae]|uniref:Phosphoglucomutase-2 n=1 Tax=Plasmodiophora brassicae TaxID=37360 RepID=A0A0G4IYG6_PLABS|nr:hypothetical protein PBRA_007863 [Plasmodiophora brassicae]SPQ98937.1 unnamed protein product [Plasmodiophora brassicae]